MTQFIHLRTHSEYSMVDGLIRIKDLINFSKQHNLPAIALTDDSNLFALIKFYRQAMEAGVQPIIGVDSWVKGPDGFGRLTLIAMNDKGYKNLLSLLSLAWLEGQESGYALLTWEWLSKYCEGLICLGGATEGEIGRLVIAGQIEKANKALVRYLNLFGDRFFFELTRLGFAGETKLCRYAVDVETKFCLPLVATNVACFSSPDDFEAHEVRVCINEGATLDDQHRIFRHSPEQWLKSPAQMVELFSDLPDAIENSVVIAKRCGVELTLGKYFLPDYPIPKNMTLDGFFEKLCLDGLKDRLSVAKMRRKLVDEALYWNRLEFEVGVIQQMGFPGYFLIVADFIQWAKDQAIPVGPGRGSGAGSIVAWSLKITDLDPIEHDLLFERFLNPERISMPDFDVDFCMEGRDRVINYVTERFGREAVCQIVTFGTMAAKAVVRDVTRVLGKPYGLGDRLAKLIPFEIGITLDKAIDAEPLLAELIENDDEVREIWKMAEKLEGLSRNTSKHAGGVVIAPGKLTDFTALLSEENGNNTLTHLDKDDVEAAGLVKFDFLGLRTLTIINWTLELIRHTTGDVLYIDQIGMEETRVFDLLCRGDTTAVFQLESRGMKDLIRRLKPTSFEDIVALVALFRPGPLQSGMVDDFINRKHGRSEVEYLHPDLEHILKNTYGVILYQEQVMQIAQVLANYSLGGADLLRRAMGKKKPEEMEKQRAIFLKGTDERGIDNRLARSIFELMAKFAGYGFNKSHSAAYALLSYQTAYLKTFYPAQFMAAVLSSDMDNTDKIVPLIEECRRMGLTIRPPDVNTGSFKFSVKDSEVIYGLGAIKGLGEGPINALVETRQIQGHFVDLFDFCRRVGSGRVNRRAVEALIKAGAFDSLEKPRWELMAAVDKAFAQVDQEARNEAAGIDDLFGLGEKGIQPESLRLSHELPAAKIWSEREMLKGEKDTLGLYLTGHPINWYQDDLRGLGIRALENLESGKENVWIAGLMVDLRILKNKRGENFGIVTLDDRTARLDVMIYADLFKKSRDLFIEDALLIVEGNVNFDEFANGFKMRAIHVDNLENRRQQFVQSVKVQLKQCDPNIADQLLGKIRPHLGGNCPIIISYNSGSVAGDVILGKEYAVHPNDALLSELQSFVGSDHVHLEFSLRTKG